jgi:class 3 adenylate cyclase
MFTDIAGYTALMGKDEASALELLNLNRKIHKPLIAQYRGKPLKEIGDGMLVSFNTVSDAGLLMLILIEGWPYGLLVTNRKVSKL